MKTATKVRDIETDRPNQQIALYRLSTPLEGHEFVVVSAVENTADVAAFDMAMSIFGLGQPGPLGGAETYIFGADASGNIPEWIELEGSFKGAMDHGRALRGAGYEIAVSA